MLFPKSKIVAILSRASMAVAAGSDSSAVVTEDGCLWELGDILCDNIDTMVPADRKSVV